ncbi:MAG: S1/P1 nuclease [Betaproteobacteria bacterium]|nr:S1/P1 nuclease [Betaproteobacteria bacterium]
MSCLGKLIPAAAGVPKHGALMILALCLACALPAKNTFAWGDEGHRLVGVIAEKYLSPAASRQVRALLKDDRAADGSLSGRRSLGEIASWADEIKDYDRTRVRRSWHYDDIPLCGVADYSRYCRKDRCASAQLARKIEILKDKGERIGRRNEALKWVVHLMGDIHQPLHAATRRDNGGNTVEVSFLGRRDNPPYGTIKLHTIWDVHMVQRLISDKGGERAIALVRIGDADRAAWERGTISDWIDESHRIAREFVYPRLPVVSSCARKIQGVVAIDEAYYSAAAPIIETRIRKAGVRLARVLNDSLGGR